MKDGKITWIDPVRKITEDENEYHVDNWLHIYDIAKRDIESYNMYPLCDVCERDLLWEETCQRCADEV